MPISVIGLVLTERANRSSVRNSIIKDINENVNMLYSQAELADTANYELGTDRGETNFNNFMARIDHQSKPDATNKATKLIKRVFIASEKKPYWTSLETVMDGIIEAEDDTTADNDTPEE